MERLKEPSKGGARLAHLDSLRGIAAVCVLAHHVGTETWLNWNRTYGGYTAHMNIGVTIFFLLSGFLLYRPFVASALSGKAQPPIGRYLRHRAFRILPAYWVALTALACWPGLTGVFTEDWWAYYALLQSYWGSFYGGIGPAWSLSVEASFYVALPLLSVLLAFLSRGLEPSRRLTLQNFSLGFLAIAGVGLNLWIRRNVWPDTIMAFWCWFALGMWLATQKVAIGPSTPRPFWLRLTMHSPGLLWGAALVIYSFLALSPMFPRSFDGKTYTAEVRTLQHVLYAMVAFLVFLPAAFPSEKNTVPNRLLTHPLLVWVGSVSYGLFLWHAPLLRVIADYEGRRFPPLLGFPVLFIPTLAVGILMGWLSYVLVEKPIMAGAAAIDRRIARNAAASAVEAAARSTGSSAN